MWPICRTHGLYSSHAKSYVTSSVCVILKLVQDVYFATWTSHGETLKPCNRPLMFLHHVNPSDVLLRYVRILSTLKRHGIFTDFLRVEDNVSTHARTLS